MPKADSLLGCFSSALWLETARMKVEVEVTAAIYFV